jgi:hypothetical protein
MPTVKIILSAAGTDDWQDRYFSYCYLSMCWLWKSTEYYSLVFRSPRNKKPDQVDPIGLKDDSSKLLPVRPTIGPDHNLNTKKAFTIRTV